MRRASLTALLVRTALLACLLLASCSQDPGAKAARFLHNGRDLMARKDYKRAALEFRNAVQLFPQDAATQYELGLAYLADGNVNAGIAAVLRATQLNPKLEAARVKLAELMAQSGDPTLAKESQKQMTQVLSASPSNTEALNALALAELQLGESDSAERHLQEALRALPKNLASSVELAQLYLAGRDSVHAEKVLKQATAAAPQSAEAAVALAAFFQVTGRWVEAQSEFERALRIAPNDAHTLASLGAMEMRLGHRDEAKEVYRTLSALADERYKHAFAAYLFADGQWNEGIQEFEKLANRAPHDRAARNRLVAAYLLAGRLAEAEKILAPALKENPNDADLRLQYSQFLLRSGRDEEAEAELKQAIRLKPDSANAHFLLGHIYGLRGERAGQIEELNAVLRYNPASEPARIALAQVLTLANSPKAALDVLSAAPESQEQTLAVVLEKNLANYAAGDLKAFRKGVAQAAGAVRTPDVLLQETLVKLMDHNYAAARATSDEALRKSPNNLRAVQTKVYSYIAQNQEAQAEKFLTSYGEQSNSAAVQEYVGEWLWAAGKHDLARTWFAKSVKTDPGFRPGYLALAEADFADGNLDKARAALREVLDKERRNLPAQILLARLETSAQRYPDAVDAYRQALALEPQNFFVLNNLAYLLADKIGKPDEALPLAKRATDVARENPDTLGTLGWVLYQKGAYREAQRYLEDAVKRDGASSRTNAVVRKYHLAMTYLKLGDKTRAEAILNAALRQNPSLPEAAMAQVGVKSSSTSF